MNIEITNDNSEEVIKAMRKACRNSLDIMGGKIETTAKKLAPVDTGRLRSSYKHEMDGDTAVLIGSEVEYAPYQELGTRYMRAQPHLQPACEQHVGEFERILQNELQNA